MTWPVIKNIWVSRVQKVKYFVCLYNEADSSNSRIIGSYWVLRQARRISENSICWINSSSRYHVQISWINHSRLRRYSGTDSGGKIFSWEIKFLQKLNSVWLTCAFLLLNLLNQGDGRGIDLICSWCIESYLRQFSRSIFCIMHENSFGIPFMWRPTNINNAQNEHTIINGNAHKKLPQKPS